MCTSIVEIAHVDGVGKRGDQWFELSHAVVSYDHARHALLDDCMVIDFMNTSHDAGDRVAVEITLESAKALHAALARAIAAAEYEEAEVRGKTETPPQRPMLPLLIAAE